MAYKIFKTKRAIKESLSNVAEDNQVRELSSQEINVVAEDSFGGAVASSLGGVEGGAFATGVAEGAKLGSFAGPVGTLSGALAGALVGATWKASS